MAPPPNLSRQEVQDIFDEAQLRAGDLYQDVPYLQIFLQENHCRALENCNLQDADLTREMYSALIFERQTFDAFNRHRLGHDEVEYKEEENIPEQVEFFPLRCAVVNRGVEVVAKPIFQLEGTVGGNQVDSGRAHVPSKNPDQLGDPTSPPLSPQLPTSPQKTGSSGGYNKLRGAPSAWLALPDGNITLAEVMAFVPQSIKSVDVINRFLFNGAMTTTLTDMINNYRVMGNGAITNNSAYRMMKGQINHHAQTHQEYENWSVAKHTQLPRPEDFDPTSVSVTGFATPVILSGREAQQAANEPTPTILFRDLANDVKVMPSGYDALDLTRCVQHCVENDDEDWYYPQHFADLVEHLGGPAPVHRKHADTASVTRHTEGKKLVNAKRAGARARDEHGRLMKGKGKAVINPDEDEQVNVNGHDEPGSEKDVAGSSLRHPQPNKRKRGPAVPVSDEEDNEDNDSDKPPPEEDQAHHHAQQAQAQAQAKKLPTMKTQPPLQSGLLNARRSR
ncbi:conserved hypothetical protein [Pyrenophora tritici-repentis Pt-1C-BFP]|uniref:Uncharacterized protein n=1 Tax=Pyrenophora tritici-repentis (strain Pt-1C-BFP) TaxID=426418 RepID=B2W3V6_PYRTR|nr:uncharacterized protein PTRG_05156 [Pyrenophora tritici-repentis Pt-1C-BFP]EDU48063.1 conserved hypothetical protein [Pyrenophora tritici-repentis Pt-1C-BFP]